MTDSAFLSQCIDGYHVAGIQNWLGQIAANIIPPLLVIALALIIWEILSSTPGASLPAPSRI